MAKLIDLTGQKFDMLTVIEKAPSRARHTYWKCKCDCGNLCEKSSESLKRDMRHNCGKCQTKKNKQQEKRNYLVGQRFGRLTVIERTDQSNNQGIIWKCKCDCGKTKNVPTGALTNKHTQSCGCLKLDSHLIDITNQKFGKLTALFFKQGESKWHCKCDCGNECDVNSYNLRHGLTQSCGCINYSIGEYHIATILTQYNYKYKKEYNPLDLAYLRYDFAIYDNANNIIRLIEFDGEQHYTDKQGLWNGQDSLEKIQLRDQEKNDWAIKNKIPLVRIPYWERNNITLDLIFGDKYRIN